MHSHSSFSFSDAEYEKVACDLCSGCDLEVLGTSRTDPARAVICRSCGLIFISPRMTREWYRRFYQEEYRSHGGVPPDREAMFANQERHGRALARELGSHLRSGGRLTEVGSSVGGVFAGMRRELGCEVFGIEPSLPEVEFARSHGIPTEAALIEDFAIRRGRSVPYSEQILVTQSLNHFLSPRFFFVWAWRTLQAGGRLVIEVKNFRQQVRRSGRLGNSIQIDHLYMFTPETLREYLAAAGFRILLLADDEGLALSEIDGRKAHGLPGYQIRAVAERGSSEPFAHVQSAIDPSAYRRVRSSLRPWRVALLHHLYYRRPGEFLRLPKPYRRSTSARGM